MSTDLEKARAEVIEAAESYIRFPGWFRLRRLHCAIDKLEDIECRVRTSDGGRMNEEAIGGEND